MAQQANPPQAQQIVIPTIDAHDFQLHPAFKNFDITNGPMANLIQDALNQLNQGGNFAQLMAQAAASPGNGLVLSRIKNLEIAPEKPEEKIEAVDPNDKKLMDRWMAENGREIVRCVVRVALGGQLRKQARSELGLNDAWPEGDEQIYTA